MSKRPKTGGDQAPATSCESAAVDGLSALWRSSGGATLFEGLSTVIAMGSLAGNVSRSASSSRSSRWAVVAMLWVDGECFFRCLKSSLPLSLSPAGKAQRKSEIYHGSRETPAPASTGGIGSARGAVRRGAQPPHHAANRPRRNSFRDHRPPVGARMTQDCVARRLSRFGAQDRGAGRAYDLFVYCQPVPWHKSHGRSFPSSDALHSTHRFQPFGFMARA